MKIMSALLLVLVILVFAGCEQHVSGNIQSKAPFDTLECVSGEPSLAVPTGFPAEEIYEAVYDGAHDGRHRFLIKDRGIFFDLDNDGTYRLHNILKKGRTYTVMVKESSVTDAREKELIADNFSPVVCGVPGEATLKNLLSTAFSPIGSTLYIYGGGWNWQDTGASNEAKSIGLAPDWRCFFDLQDENYTYISENREESYFPHGRYNEYRFAGLDCSGYLGWVIYNVTNAANGNDGCVVPSTEFAASLEKNSWGRLKKDAGALLPGDIVSINGHVWLCVGACEDGSAVIVHSTPSPSRKGYYGGGVQLSAIGDSAECEAYGLASAYMSKYYPAWYARYSPMLFSYADYTRFDTDVTGVFSWDLSDGGFLKDPDGIVNMSASEILELIYQNE